MPRSRAIWIAVGRRLVEFFGGSVIYQDCGSSRPNFRRPHKTWQENSPEDGKAWYSFQQRILDIVPLSEKEWRSLDKYAAYKIES